MVTVISHDLSDCAFLSCGRLLSTSIHTAWNTSAASSGEAPYLIGIEKISLLYLSMSCSQAFASPCKQPWTSHSSSIASTPSLQVHDSALTSLMSAVWGPGGNCEVSTVYSSEDFIVPFLFWH